MKCPKCGYLGYERVERCRNCGYEFSLASSRPTPDLRMREGDDTPRPLDDLDLLDARMERHAASPARDLRTSVDGIGARDGGSQLVELPLFGPPIADDVPLITRPSPPRPPLAVRRATPEVPRVRSEPRTPLLEWPPDAIPAPAPVAPSPPRVVRPADRREAVSEAGQHDAEPATFGARAFAAAIDVGLLALVDLVVVYFTMKICGVSRSELALLPKMPLFAFLLVQNGGYLVAFTAAGQTLGKLIAGVRVLADDSLSAPDLSRAALRTMAWCVLAIPAGLGLVSAAFSRDGRGIHDRFAGTRVVRAGA